MDACLELLLLNKHPLYSLELYQKKIIWEELEYPQNPKYYIWGEYIHLVECPIPRTIRDYLPPSFAKEEWVCFSVKGQVLDLLELEVNGSDIDWKERTLDSLFKLLLTPQNKWVVVFDWQCDQIDKIYNLNITDCISTLRNNLKYENSREDFIVLST